LARSGGSAEVAQSYPAGLWDLTAIRGSSQGGQNARWTDLL